MARTLDYLKTKILIIDDEKAILKMLHQRFSRMGFLVDLAGSGEEGIHKIQHQAYDLIFTDIKMPGMSGNSFYRHVREKLNNQIPIIAMSGTPWLLESSDFNAIVAKPFSKEDLLKLVEQFVQRT